MTFPDDALGKDTSLVQYNEPSSFKDNLFNLDSLLLIIIIRPTKIGTKLNLVCYVVKDPTCQRDNSFTPTNYFLGNKHSSFPCH